MKTKIAAILTAILSVLLVSDVHAYQAYDGSFYEAEKIKGVYFYKHRDDTDTKKYQYHNFHSQATIYRKTTDNNVVYCVESWEPISRAPNGSHLIVNRRYPDSWEYDVSSRVEALAYYGYGYKEGVYDHTDPKWYAVTQFLIWQATSSDIKHYFTSSISSTTPIYPFENEIGELNYLVNQHTIKPLIEDYINKQNIEVGKRVILKDVRNVLDNYQKIESSTLSVEKISSTELAVTASTEGNHNLYLFQSYNYYNKPYTYYRSDKYQDMLEPGDILLRRETFGFTAKIPRDDSASTEIVEIVVKPDESDNTSTEETSNDEDIKEGTISSDIFEETGGGENEEETPSESEEETPDEKNEEEKTEFEEGDKNLPIEEPPNNPGKNEDTSSSDKFEEPGDTGNKEVNPSEEDDKILNNKNEDEEANNPGKEDNESSTDEEINIPENKEDTPPSDKFEEPGNTDKKGEVVPDADDTPDNKDNGEEEREPGEGNKDLPIEENPNVPENKEDTSSSDKSEENDNGDKKEDIPSESEDTTPDNKDEGEEKQEYEEDDKTAKDETSNNSENNEESMPSLPENEDKIKTEDYFDDKPIINNNQENESVGINKGTTTSNEKDKHDEELVNKELVNKLENDYEPIEVEVPATDASVLSVLFYFLSIFGLVFIHHAK